MIHVLATVELRPGKRETFLTEFHRIVPVVRAEAGCLEYGPAVDLHTGIAVQLPVRDNVVTVVEKWESLEALRAHMAAPHMVQYRERVKDLVVKVVLQILEPARRKATTLTSDFPPPYRVGERGALACSFRPRPVIANGSFALSREVTLFCGEGDGIYVNCPTWKKGPESRLV